MDVTDLVSSGKVDGCALLALLDVLEQKAQMKDFNDKVVVITGAAGGVGTALAKKLAGLGASLALVDVNPDSLDVLRNKLELANDRVTTHTADLADKASVRALVDDVIAQHGKVNVLVNNAGITYQKFFETHSIEDWEKIVGVNWWGVIYCCHYFLDALKEAGDAHIINLSSMNAFTGLPSQSSYCATKAAVQLLSESLRAELKGANIGVTSVHPGAIKTDMIKATLENSDDVDVAKRNYLLAQKIGVSPEYVAERIIGAIKKNPARIRVGADAVIIDFAKRYFPSSLGRLLSKAA